MVWIGICIDSLVFHDDGVLSRGECNQRIRSRFRVWKMKYAAIVRQMKPNSG